MEKSFSDYLAEFIVFLEAEAIKTPDPALKKIIELMREVKTSKELKKKKDLINYVAVDSLQDRNVGEAILIFTNNFSRFKI